MPRTSTSFSPNPVLRMASGQTVAGTSSLPSLSALTTPFDQHTGGAPALQGLGRFIDTLDRYLRLPSTPQGFMLYLAGLTLVFTGALLQVLVAAQIMAAKIELAALESEIALIEQQNGDLIFEISRYLNFGELQVQALSMGYGPATAREYVFVEEPAPLAAAPASAAEPPAPLTPAATPPTASPATMPGDQAPWRAWSAFICLPVPSGWAQADAGAPAPPALITELSKQLERLGIR